MNTYVLSRCACAAPSLLAGIPCRPGPDEFEHIRGAGIIIPRQEQRDVPHVLIQPADRTAEAEQELCSRLHLLRRRLLQSVFLCFLSAPLLLRCYHAPTPPPEAITLALWGQSTKRRQTPNAVHGVLSPTRHHCSWSADHSSYASGRPLGPKLTYLRPRPPLPPVSILPRARRTLVGIENVCNIESGG